MTNSNRMVFTNNMLKMSKMLSCKTNYSNSFIYNITSHNNHNNSKIDHRINNSKIDHRINNNRIKHRSCCHCHLKA
mgnify:CR=1 FL=1